MQKEVERDEIEITDLFTGVFEDESCCSRLPALKIKLMRVLCGLLRFTMEIMVRCGFAISPRFLQINK
jgi:hypothetical protein